MQKIEWSDDYSLHNETVDLQHQQLFQIMSDAQDSIKQGDRDTVVAGLIERLVQYTHTHFQDEERLMDQAAYPEIEIHKALHANMLAKLEQMGELLETGSVTRLEILVFIHEWLKDHILVEDMKMRNYLYDD